MTVLGVLYYGSTNGLSASSWVSFHSPTLINGNLSYINDFITMAQYPNLSWNKTYPITTNDQKLIFQFRTITDNFTEPDEERLEFEEFIFELYLRW